MRHGSFSNWLIPYCLSSLRGRGVYSLPLENGMGSLGCLIGHVSDSCNLHMSHVLLLLLGVDACENQYLGQIIQFYSVVSLLDTFGSTEELLLWAEQYKIRLQSFGCHLLNCCTNCNSLEKDCFVSVGTSMGRYDHSRSAFTSKEGLKADSIVFGLSEALNCHHSTLGRVTLFIRPSVQPEFQMFANTISSCMRKYSGNLMKAVIISSLQHSHNTSNFITFLIKSKVKVIFVQKTVSEDIKEHLLSENIFLFERLGKVQICELKNFIHGSFFSSIDEFLFSMSNSHASLASVKLKLKRDAFGVFVEVKKKRMHNNLIVASENHGHSLEGGLIERHGVFSFSHVLSLRAFGPGKSSFAKIDAFFELFKLFIVNLLCESFLSRRVTVSEKGTTRRSILKLLWSKRLFESLNYSIRLLQSC